MTIRRSNRLFDSAPGGVRGRGPDDFCTLQSAYRAERARQAPEQRSSPLLTVAVAIGVYAGLAWLTDYRSALTLALAGIALIVLVGNVRRHGAKETAGPSSLAPESSPFDTPHVTHFPTPDK